MSSLINYSETWSMQHFVDHVDSRLSKHVLTVGGGSVCIVVYLCSDVKGMFFVHFKGMLFSVLSLLSVLY